MLKLVGNVQFKEETREAEAITRLMAAHQCRVGGALKMAVGRYARIMRETPPPPHALVHALWHVLTSSGRRGYEEGEYPTVDDVVERVNVSPMADEVRTQLREYLLGCSFAEFARLIEAVEAM